MFLPREKLTSKADYFRQHFPLSRIPLQIFFVNPFFGFFWDYFLALANCRLLVVGCWLFVVGYWLFVVCPWVSRLVAVLRFLEKNRLDFVPASRQRAIALISKDSFFLWIVVSRLLLGFKGIN